MGTYTFKGIVKTQWSKYLGLYGMHITLCLNAESEQAARQLARRTILRPFTHPDDAFFSAHASKGELPTEPGAFVWTVNGWREPRIPSLV